MTTEIRPINITTAALTTQFMLIVIVAVATWFRDTRDRDNNFRLLWIILILALTTIGPLVFSDELMGVWLPLFGDAAVPSVPR